jgi:hypothetical protein
MRKSDSKSRSGAAKRATGRIAEGGSSVALLAFLGALLGALISGGVAIYLQHRSEGREQKAALRLVDAELEIDSGHLEGLLEHATVPDNFRALEGKTRFLPALAWEENKDVLATELSGKLWYDTSWIYGLLDDTRLALADQKPGEPLVERVRGKAVDVQLLPASLYSLCELIARTREAWPEKTGARTFHCARPMD